MSNSQQWMVGWLQGLVLLLLSTTAGATSLPFLLTIETSDGAQVPVTIQEPQGTDRQVTTPWTGTIAAPNAASIRLQAEGYWAPPFAEDEAHRELRSVLRPTGKLLLPPPQGSLEEGSAVRVKFQLLGDSTRNDRSNPDLAKYSEACPLQEAGWICELPAGRLDLEFTQEGFAPVYLWDLELATGANNELGPIRWIRGGSVRGWLVNEGGEDLTADILVRPATLGATPDPTPRRRQKLQELFTRSDERGFFQIAGLPPGAYHLRAVREGFDSREHTFEVTHPGEEIALENTVSIAPLATFEIHVEPMVDPWGDAWTIELSRALGGNGSFESFARGATDDSGSWRKERMPSQEVLLSITDSKGSQWVYETLTVRHDMPPLFRAIDLVPVRGRLMLGGTGIPGILAFGSSEGTTSIRMQADEDGRFSGHLPYEGRWPLDLRLNDSPIQQAAEPVWVEQPSGKSFAEVEIDLPDTELRGRVLEGDRPARAVVLAVREMAGDTNRRRKDLSLVTDADEGGTFILRGLSPGSLQLSAYDSARSSDVHLIELREEQPVEIDLQLRKKVHLSGRLLTSTGTPLPNAQIVARPDVGLATGTQSDFEGHFELRLPAEVRSVDLMILPTGAGLFFERLHLTGDSLKDLQLATSRVTGTVILPQPGRATGYLYFHGVGERFDRILGSMLQAGRLSPNTAGGLSLKGLAPGLWSQCPGAFDPETCQTVEVIPGQETLLPAVYDEQEASTPSSPHEQLIQTLD